MFLNCGKLVEINLNLSATYLSNDLLKTFTNALQMTKFHKNHKKIPQRQSWANCGPHADLFFCFLPIFSGKIVELRKCSALWEQFEPTLSKKGGLCEKG